jgi:hypothetical protein
MNEGQAAVSIHDAVMRPALPEVGIQSHNPTGTAIVQAVERHWVRFLGMLCCIASPQFERRGTGDPDRVQKL